MLGWKRIKYKELNRDHQDEIDEGNYLECFHTLADLYSISKPAKRLLCQECSPGAFPFSKLRDFETKNNEAAWPNALGSWCCKFKASTLPLAGFLSQQSRAQILGHAL